MSIEFQGFIEPLHSYECVNCGAWSHLPESDDDKAPPVFCPYCGEQTLIWRNDNMWQIAES